MTDILNDILVICFTVFIYTIFSEKKKKRKMILIYFTGYKLVKLNDFSTVFKKIRYVYHLPIHCYGCRTFIPMSRYATRSRIEIAYSEYREIVIRFTNIFLINC